MRNFIDIVNEVAVVDNGRLSGCAVWKNPSSRDLQILAADRDLRGLVDGNTVYVWPAEMATHRMIPAQIGIEYHDYLLPFYVESDAFVMAQHSFRNQWCEGEPEFYVGDVSVFCNRDVFTVEDYLYSRGFCKMVGEVDKASPDLGSIHHAP